jgi:transcriptional regulator with XRE-family HTH domain
MILAEVRTELFRRGISQAQLAAAIRRDASFVSKLVHGKIAARRKVRRQISAFLKVPERRLFPQAWKQRQLQGGEIKTRSEASFWALERGSSSRKPWKRIRATPKSGRKKTGTVQEGSAWAK